MIRFCLAAAAALFLTVSPLAARAESAFHPSRSLLLIHSKTAVGPSDDIQFRFIPKFTPAGEVAPITYLGARHKVVDGLGVELYTGWAFQPDEPLFSLSLDPRVGKFWGWTETDLLPKSRDGYYFAQGEYELAKWLSLGAEVEGWGNFADSKSWSHGAGGNVILNFGQVALDLIVQMRTPTFVYEFKPEFSLRFHLFI